MTQNDEFKRHSHGRPIRWTLGGWLGSHLTLIAGHVLLVFLYSVTLAPGRDPEHYSEFAQASGPWFSIVAGGPVFFLLGRYLRRSLGDPARPVGWAIWTLYSVTDLSVVLAFHGIPGIGLATQWIASQAIKGVAIGFGTRRRISHERIEIRS